MNWELAYTNDPNNVRDYATPAEIKASGITVLEANVPGCFENELVKIGLEDGYYFADNIKNLGKYDNTHVWYFSEFGAYEFDCLVFEGIAGRADIFVNGEKTAESYGPLLTHKIQDNIIDGKNTVVVHVYPSATGSGLNVKGLVKPAYIKRKRKCEIKNAYIRTVSVDPEEESAVVRFTADVDIRRDSQHEFQHLNCKAEIRDEKRVYSSKCDLFGSRVDLTVEVPRAKLWWPRNYGRSFLYDASITVFDGGKQLDEFDVSLGIRTVWLETEIKEGGGEVSYISVNGRRLNLTGPVWRSLDVMGLEDEEKLERVFECVTDLSCNVLYVQGVDCSFSERFYDLCDRNGIAVVQEFPVLSEKVPETAREEARQITDFLRNHPSVLACCSTSHYAADSLKNMAPEIPAIPRLGDEGSVFTTCGSVPSLPSSASVKKFVPRANVWPVADENGIVDASYEVHFGNPSCGESYPVSSLFDGVGGFFDRSIEKMNPFCRQSQIVQAEYLKGVIENARARRTSGNGIIWKSLTDGWPAVSDSVSDYYSVRKLAYFYVKRSQNPLLLALVEADEKGTYDLHAINDQRYGDEITFVVKDLTEAGKIVASGMAELAPDSNTVLENVRLAENRFYLISWTPRTGRSITNHFFAGSAATDYNSYTDALKKCNYYDFEGFEE